MSKKKNDQQDVIVDGKTVIVTAESRKDAVRQINDLRKKAEKAGLKQAEGGFIEYCDGSFSAAITFIEN